MRKINSEFLDVELIQYAEEYEQNAVALEALRAEYDQVNFEFEHLQATVNLDVRKNPDVYLGAVKVTEDVIKNYLLVEPRLVTARQRLINLKSTINQQQGHISVLVERRRVLEHLIELSKILYFQIPIEKKTLEERIKTVRG